MVRDITELVVYITSFTTLLPGDVILTGTPEGVGPMLPGQEVERHRRRHRHADQPRHPALSSVDRST